MTIPDTLFMTLIIPGIAQAEKIDFSKCEASVDRHCYVFSPKLNQAGGVNTHVEMHFPDNNAPVIIEAHSPDNYTHVQNNVAVISIQNSYKTTENLTLNYCPTALTVLLSQGTPEYMDKFYNATTGLDLTGGIYPKWCHRESGVNPINGDNTIVVPEFPLFDKTIISLAIAFVITFSILYTKFNHGLGVSMK